MEQSDLLVKRCCHVHSVWRPEGEGEALTPYLAQIFRHAAKQLFNEDVREVTCHTLKNKEVTLEKNGEVLLRLAAVGCLNDRGQAQTEDGHADRCCCGRWKAPTLTSPCSPLDQRPHAGAIPGVAKQGRRPTESRKPCTQCTRAQGSLPSPETSS
ncbi:hypothetical protein GH733_017727, partial [Mirounga leonina]